MTKLDELRSKLKNVREHAERAATSVVSGAIAAGTGAAIGLAAAYNEEKPGEVQEVSGVPITVVVGFLGNMLAMTTKKEHMSEYFRSAGNAGFAIAAFDYMKVKGQEWKNDEATGGHTPMTSVRRIGNAVGTTVHRLDGGQRVTDSASRLPVAMGDYAR